ncbi:MAG: hypothetical protein JW919_02655 [Candidatus Omnitrophica bacterium]|nr:hypothetical protein [Candidatus Omnitrophota bacterium]
MRFTRLVSVFLCAAFIFTLAGCGVSKDKYEALLNEKIALEEKVNILIRSKDALKKEYDELLKEKMDLDIRVETIANEKNALKVEYDKILDEKIVLRAEYDKLLAEANKAK